MSLFRRKKTPAELLKTVATNLAVVAAEDADEKSSTRANERLSAAVSAIKVSLYGDQENEARPERVTELVSGLVADRLLIDLLRSLKLLDFEARKDVAQIWAFFLKQHAADATAHVLANPEVFSLLVNAYDEPQIALNCGAILRECLRHKDLAEQLLVSPPSPLFLSFFRFVQMSTFDVASDAFSTFKTLLTKHKPVASAFLESNYAEVFKHYNQLLESRNYVTKRQSLKLLGELLLDRANFRVMMLYINEAENLKLMMNLLRKTTKSIQFEAFHVFKIFVANPRKSKPVIDILLHNRERLIEFLNRFQPSKGPEDEQFAEEKRILLQALDKLDGGSAAPAPAAAAPAAAAEAKQA